MQQAFLVSDSAAFPGSSRQPRVRAGSTVVCNCSSSGSSLVPLCSKLCICVNYRISGSRQRPVAPCCSSPHCADRRTLSDAAGWAGDSHAALPCSDVVLCLQLGLGVLSQPQRWVCGSAGFCSGRAEVRADPTCEHRADVQRSVRCLTWMLCIPVSPWPWLSF